MTKEKLIKAIKNLKNSNSLLSCIEKNISCNYQYKQGFYTYIKGTLLESGKISDGILSKIEIDKDGLTHKFIYDISKEDWIEW